MSSGLRTYVGESAARPASSTTRMHTSAKARYRTTWTHYGRRWEGAASLFPFSELGTRIYKCERFCSFSRCLSLENVSRVLRMYGHYLRCVPACVRERAKQRLNELRSPRSSFSSSLSLSLSLSIASKRSSRGPLREPKTLGIEISKSLAVVLRSYSPTCPPPPAPNRTLTSFFHPTPYYAYLSSLHSVYSFLTSLFYFTRIIEHTNKS
jgi:hypothetical protein